MWLGERPAGHGRFPALGLSNTNDTFDLGEHPQPLVRLIYSTPRLPETAKVELWRPRALRRNLRRPPRPYQCQRRFDVDVPGARAWIEATYLREPRRASGRCPHRGAFITAVAFFDKVGGHDRRERLLPLGRAAIRLAGRPAHTAAGAAPASAADPMSRAFAAAVVVAVLTAVAPAAVPAAPLAPETLTLRLHDLGPGYSDDGPCERWPPAHAYWPSSLQRLAARFGRKGCRILFAQAWQKHDSARPESIESDAFVFDSAAGPKAAMPYDRALVALAIGAERDEIAPVVPAGTVGDETHVFRTASYEGPGFAVLWRSGTLLALVHAVGPAGAVTQQTALQLAAAQQARIVSPSPLQPSDLDDLEVPLDDPSLRLPVQWLGRAMPAHDGRFPLTLYLADGQGPGHSRTEPSVTLQYGHEGRLRHDRRRVRVEIIDVDLELWAPSAKRRLLQEELNRSCVRRYDGGLDGIDATIFSSSRSPRRSCGSKPPEVWRALALFRDVAVTIDPNICTLCRRKGATYASLAGLRILLRALHPREPRPLPAPAPY